MASFFSKASSFLSSQADRQDPNHAAKADSEVDSPKPAGSGGYADLLSEAQTLIKCAPPHCDDRTLNKESSGGYGDLLASAQSLMATAKPTAADKEEETRKSPSSGGYGDLLANAETLMATTKLGSGEGTPVDKKEADLKTAGSGKSEYGDMYASAQVLMGAVKSSRDGTATDMGEVAGATADLIGAASHHGNLEKTAYGDYAQKAQTYLQDYQTSHGKPSAQEAHQKHVAESAEEGSKPVLPSAQEAHQKPVAGSAEEGSKPALSKPQEEEEFQ